MKRSSKTSSRKKKIIIATSKRTIDDQIASFAKINSIDIFRGNYKDIVKRAYDCCQFFNLKKFARICGDRPFFDPKILNFLFTYLDRKKKLTLQLIIKLKHSQPEWFVKY